MKIKLKKGFALNQRADVIINSANNFLFHRTGSAAKLRIKSGILNKKEKTEFTNTLKKLKPEIQDFFEDKFRKKYNAFYYSSLSALRIIANKKRLELGQAIFDNDWSKNSKTPVIHLILIKHKYKNKKHKVIKTNKKILKKALHNAFKIISKKGYKSVAIPVMVARGMYGLTPKQSYETILRSLNDLKESTRVKKITICFDNKYTKNYFKSLKSEK